MLLMIITLVIPERPSIVDPLYNILNQKPQAYGIFYEDLSIDESMVSYYGHHS